MRFSRRAKEATFASATSIAAGRGPIDAARDEVYVATFETPAECA